MSNRFLILTTASCLVSVCCSSCQDDPVDAGSCSADSGSFEIVLNNASHDLQLTSETQFTIVYNWFGNYENNIVLTGKDQNGDIMEVESILPNPLNEGTHQFDTTTMNFDFFDIALGSSSYYTSTITLEIEESNLDLQNGVYKPISGTFIGTAHSYPWVNGQPPIDTHSFQGTFCLNGTVM